MFDDNTSLLIATKPTSSRHVGIIRLSLEIWKQSDKQWWLPQGTLIYGIRAIWIDDTIEVKLEWGGFPAVPEADAIPTYDFDVTEHHDYMQIRPYIGGLEDANQA